MRYSRLDAMMARFRSMVSLCFISAYSRFSFLTYSFSSLFSRLMRYFSVSDFGLRSLIITGATFILLATPTGVPGFQRWFLRLYLVPTPARLLKTTPIIIITMLEDRNDTAKHMLDNFSPKVS